jgi:hypothetical protein
VVRYAEPVVQTAEHTMNDLIDQFRQAIAAAGLTPPTEIIDDGAIHRFSAKRQTHPQKRLVHAAHRRHRRWGVW